MTSSTFLSKQAGTTPPSPGGGATRSGVNQSNTAGGFSSSWGSDANVERRDKHSQTASRADDLFKDKVTDRAQNSALYKGLNSAVNYGYDMKNAQSFGERADIMGNTASKAWGAATSPARNLWNKGVDLTKRVGSQAADTLSSRSFRDKAFNLGHGVADFTLGWIPGIGGAFDDAKDARNQANLETDRNELNGLYATQDRSVAGDIQRMMGKGNHSSNMARIRQLESRANNYR